MKQEIVPQGADLLLFRYHQFSSIQLSDFVDCLHKRFNIQMGINSLCEGHGTCVTDDLLNHGLIYMGFCQLCDAGVPLRYNNDKPEKPRIAMVYGYRL